MASTNGCSNCASGRIHTELASLTSDWGSVASRRIRLPHCTAVAAASAEPSAPAISSRVSPAAPICTIASARYRLTGEKLPLACGSSPSTAAALR